MAIIICPECGGRVSDQASTCIHCGYPLQTNKIRQIGFYGLVLTKIRANGVGLLYDVLGYDYKERKDIIDKANQKGSNGIVIAVSTRSSEMENIMSRFAQSNSSMSIVPIDPANPPNYAYTSKVLAQLPMAQGGIPRCPTCGSIDISKISDLNRAASVAMFGRASRKINKSFVCNNCGYTW